MTGLTILFFGGIWETLGLETQGLVGHHSRFLEDYSIETNVDYGSTDQDVSEGKLLVTVLETILVIF